MRFFCFVLDLIICLVELVVLKGKEKEETLNPILATEEIFDTNTNTNTNMTSTMNVKAPKQLVNLDEASILQLEVDMRSAQGADRVFQVRAVIATKIIRYIDMKIKTLNDKGESWDLWKHEQLIPALRNLVMSNCKEDDHGVFRALTLIKALNTQQLRIREWESNRNWLIDAADIILRTVTESARLSSDKAVMLPLREALITFLRKNPFSEGILKKLKSAPGYGELIVWEEWWSQLHHHYDIAQTVITSSDFYTYAPKGDKDTDNTKGDSKNFNQPRKKQRWGDTTEKPASQTTKDTSGSSKSQTTSHYGPGLPVDHGKGSHIKGCYRCGRTNHQGNTCKLRGIGGTQAHPDINKNYDIEWSKSTQGKAWADKNQSVCPMTFCLDNSKYTPPKCKFTSYESDLFDTSLCNTCGVVGYNANIRPLPDTVYKHGPVHSCKILSKINPLLPPLSVEVLLDTGCEGVKNYVSQKIADQLKDYGYMPTLVDDQRLVCSCFSGVCRPVNESFKLRIQIYDTSLQIYRTITVMCDVTDTPHDVIVGFETIEAIQVLRTELINDITQSAIRKERAEQQSEGESSGEEGSHDLTHTVIDIPQVGLPDKKPRKRGRHPSPMVRNKKVSVNTITPVKNMNTIPEGIFGSTTLKTGLLEICESVRSIFKRTLDIEPAKITPMDIEFKANSQWNVSSNQQPARLQSRVKAEEIVKQVDDMLTSGVIRVSKAPAHSQVMLTPKKNGSWRFCIDYRRLNVITSATHWPLPRIKEMLQRLGTKKAAYFAVIDLTKGYYQAPLSEAAKERTAFITPNGLYEWNRVAMGLTGSPSYFQKAMSTEVLNGLIYTICEIYLDDIIIYGTTEEEFLQNVKTVFDRLKEKNITVNPDKCQMGLTEVEYVGHTINKDGISFSREKLSKVINIDLPTTSKGLKSFLGLANYFRDHVRNHSIIAQPLHKMLENYNPKKMLVWDDFLKTQFYELRKAVNECPQLFFIDDTSPVHLYTDASLSGIGAYLCQVVDGKEVPIAFYSKSLKDEETRWGIPCLEAYAIWAAFKSFDYLLRDAFTHIHTDHKNLVYIRDSGNEKIIRWKLDLQEYAFDIDAILGVDNPIADFMSRNKGAEIHDLEVNTPKRAVNMLNCMNVQYEQEHTPTSQLNAINYSTIHIPQDAYHNIETVHNESVGHHGVERTLEKLANKDLRWPNMREHVRKFCRECDNCQKASYLQYDIKAPRYNIGKFMPMERLSVDLIGPLNPTSGGQKHILVVIDCFTRFATATPIPNKTAKIVADALMVHFGYFGVPYELMSDGGKEFVNPIIKELLEMIGSKNTTTLAYSHEENSIVERANKEIVAWMRHMIYGDKKNHDEWVQTVPFAVRIHNATTIDTLQYSPAELLFGDSILLDKNILLPKGNRVQRTDLTTFMKDRRTLQDRMIQRAQAHQKEVQKKHRSGGTQDKITIFNSGEYVLLAYPETAMRTRRPRKLYMMHRGPYKVISHVEHRYTIENLITKKREDRPIFLLRPYYYDPTRTNPQDMALKDFKGEYYVERIIAHTGSWKTISRMTFTVKWFGYAEPETGQKWKDLKYVDEFHDYLKLQGQERHIITIPSDDEDDSDSD